MDGLAKLAAFQPQERIIAPAAAGCKLVPDDNNGIRYRFPSDGTRINADNTRTVDLQAR
jgi:hypothetical protein